MEEVLFVFSMCHSRYGRVTIIAVRILENPNDTSFDAPPVIDIYPCLPEKVAGGGARREGWQEGLYIAHPRGCCGPGGWRHLIRAIRRRMARFSAVIIRLCAIHLESMLYK